MFKIECLSDIQKSYLCNMKIYFINGTEAFDDKFIEECSTFFPQWRKDKMLSYKFLNGKVQNALAYLLLLYALREEGIFTEMPEFCYGEHNKPYLKNYPDWHFNFSHCKNAVCCVLSKEEVGIDIEEVNLYKENLAAYISNEKELDFLHKSENPADDFFRLWTQKEAAFKMLGSGITKEIKDILNNSDIIVKSHRINNLWISISYRKPTNIQNHE